MLKIDFGEEMVSVLNKDNMEIYPQPSAKESAIKPKPQQSPVPPLAPSYPTLPMHISPKTPVQMQTPNSLKMTIKTGPSPLGLTKSPHAPKSMTYTAKSVVIPRKRKVETPTSPNIIPYIPSNPRPTDSPIFKERRASSSSISSSNSSVVRDTNLYCYCQKPTSKDLIGCDHCPQWYHPACLNLSEETIKSILNLPAWKCPECEKKSALAKKAKKAKQGPLYLPIPSGAKFCEIKATRLDTWGTDEYDTAGFIPLDRTTWVSFNNTGSPSPVPPNDEIPPLPEDLAAEIGTTPNTVENGMDEHSMDQPKSQIVQESFPLLAESKPDRIRPSEVLNKKGVQAPKANLVVDKPDETITPTSSEVQHPEKINEPPTVAPQQISRPVGRPRINKELVPPSQPQEVVEKSEPVPQAVTRIVGRPKQYREPVPQVALVPPVVDAEKPRMSTSEAAVERMKNEMKVAAELNLIEEAERIRDEAEKMRKEGKLVPNGSKNAGPTSRRGRRPQYRPTGTAPIPAKTGKQTKTAQLQAKAELAPLPMKTVDVINDSVPEANISAPPVEKDHLKVKHVPRGRRSSPNVRSPASLDEQIVKNIKKEKMDHEIKKEKITDHSMEEILSKDANEISRTKTKKRSKSLSNQNNESIPEESVPNTSPEPSDIKPDEENNADSSKNESYDELFFCYICKSIYVSKKALANHQKSAHSK